MITFTTKYQWQHAISVGIALIIAILINNYFAFSENGWIIISTLLVMQTTRGTPVRQALLYTFCILFALSCGFLLINFFNNNYIVLSILGLIFIISVYFSLSEIRIQTKRYFFLVIFLFAFMITVLYPEKITIITIRNQFIDVAIGTLIGILSATIIFPVKMDYEFKRGIVPILESMRECMQTASFALGESLVQDRLNTQKTALQLALIADNNLYPEWIFETGFNPGLRSGFRFFLLQIERVTELFFSISHHISTNLNIDISNELAPLFEMVMQKNSELITILIDYFKSDAIPKTDSDFTGDIAELETNAKKILPSSLDLLDLTPEYLSLTALIRDIKDLRGVLLQLVMALPATQFVKK